MIDIIDIPAYIIPTSLILVAYITGSVASAVLVCKLAGLTDPRTGGSGHPGATNVMRLHGKKVAILALSGDILTGVIPVLLAKAIVSSELIIALCGFAAFLGHLFPVFFKFKGGKGVATLIGILFATHWLLGLAYVTTWLITAIIFRYSSLSALIAALFTPLFSWLILHIPAYLVCHTIMVTTLIWRHQSNIRNLLAGTEDKMGQDCGRT